MSRPGKSFASPCREKAVPIEKDGHGRFGTKAIKEAAAGYGRHVTTSQEAPTEGVALGPVCRELAVRGEVQPGVPCPDHCVTEEAIVLLKGLLALDFRQRLSASKALRLPFFKDVVISKES